MKRIPERVKAFRLLRGLSQKELADRAGMSVTTINHIESGEYNWSCATIIKIEEVLDARLF